jgi:hypothetical protein
MGTWDIKINGNDTFLDIYDYFFNLYNQGEDPITISLQILRNFADSFEDYDEKNDSLFALALAQWETKSLNPEIFDQVKKIIESGNDMDRWKESGADEKTLKKRQVVLNKFLAQLSTERAKAKRRTSTAKYESTFKEIINLQAPDGQKTFTIFEHYTDGAYVHTGSMLSWRGGGGSVLYFTGQGKFISAKWRDSQTLVITHDIHIVFTKKDEAFYFNGDAGVVIYNPTALHAV